VKNQHAPWGDPLFFENPGDEVFFGEVYRQILQESWLPDGAEEWSVLGKSRRGHRPTQRGVTSPNLSPDQETVRRYFVNCVSGWRDLPWELPASPYCDNRNDRKHWYEQKQAHGVMCSYYDLFMRNCLRVSIDTGCPPPTAYKLKINADLSSVTCLTHYPISSPNLCGHLSLQDGPGSFSELTGWLSPSTGTEGFLCFSDANGSLGSVPYFFDPHIFSFQYDPTNPHEIDPNLPSGLSIFILGGMPPFTWSVSGIEGQSGFSFLSETTQSRSNLLTTSSACGSAEITVLDSCAHTVTGFIRCTAGNWVLASPEPECQSRCGNPPWTVVYVDCSVISRWKLWKCIPPAANCWCGTGPSSIGPCGSYCGAYYYTEGSLGQFECQEWRC